MAERAIGTSLIMNPDAVSPATPTDIGGLTSIGGLALSAETLDKTTLKSTGGYREFTGGFKDGGEISLAGYFDNTEGVGQSALYAAFESGAVNPYAIEFPEELNAKWLFGGVVTAFETGAELEDLVSFAATIKVSGQPTLTTLT